MSALCSVLWLVAMAIALTNFAQPTQAAFVATQTQANAASGTAADSDADAERRLAELEISMREAVGALRRVLGEIDAWGKEERVERSAVELLEQLSEKRAAGVRGNKRVKMMRWG